MSYHVELTAAAERDLQRIVDYIAEHGLPERARPVLDAIEVRIDALETTPNRGTHARELTALGIRDFREVFFKPYRIVYRVFDDDDVVRVFLIADGRRSLQGVLERRLLEA